MDIEAIKALVRDVPDFPDPGIIYRDITPVLADPIAFSTLIDLIVVHFGRGNVDKVVGIEARGFVVAAPIAVRLGAGFVPVRKAGKLPWEIEQEEYAPVATPTNMANAKSFSVVPPKNSRDRIGSSTTSEVLTDRISTWLRDMSTTPA